MLPSRAPDLLGDFLTFRRMITPVIIQVLFWIMAGVTLIAGVVGLLTSIGAMFAESFVTGVVGILGNLAFVVLGVLFARVFCELVILAFRINETLTDIRDRQGGGGDHGSVGPAAEGPPGSPSA